VCALCQPNCHNGTDHLPLHLDEPGFEGFGVVVVTVAVEGGTAKIVLLDEGGDDETEVERAWSFDLQEGEAYVIAADARNKCLHGVWAEKAPHRKSLNLRFGIRI
jgi:hypothetical protein